ncbi:MAG TPA: hypothetical protein VLB86_15840, partial [Gaiellaceae bacterium]|nr:hypothetical protein [Gaiellaceae bacterium]
MRYPSLMRLASLPIAVSATLLGALLVATEGASAPRPLAPKASVGTLSLRNGAVTTPKLRNGAVTPVKLRRAAVTWPKLARWAV